MRWPSHAHIKQVSFKWKTHNTRCCVRVWDGWGWTIERARKLQRELWTAQITSFIVDHYVIFKWRMRIYCVRVCRANVCVYRCQASKSFNIFSIMTKSTITPNGRNRHIPSKNRERDGKKLIVFSMMTTAAATIWGRRGQWHIITQKQYIIAVVCVFVSAAAAAATDLAWHTFYVQK